jgi:hypothetical protein
MAGGDLAPFFEWSGYDCIFPEHARIFDRNGFPIVSTNAFVIEVENNFDEFAFTCRFLLDIVAKARVGIFFQKKPNSAHLDTMSAEFAKPWKSFGESYGDSYGTVWPANLWVVVLPDEYVDDAQFRGGALLARWDAEGGRFVAA